MRKAAATRRRSPAKSKSASRRRRELTDEELYHAPKEKGVAADDAAAERVETDIVRAVRHYMAAEREILSAILAVLQVSERTIRDALGSLETSPDQRRHVERRDPDDAPAKEPDVAAKKTARVVEIEEIEVE